MRPHSPPLFLAAVLAIGSAGFAEGPDARPKPVPATRTELKQALDNLKRRQPRLPLPAPSEELKAKAGDLPLVNNVLMRAHYLDPELRWESAWRAVDPHMSLERPFKTMFFWIVARSNNCHYCLGHQESGLAKAGLSDDAIAALDGDWSEFTPAQRAAFTFVRRITYFPHEIGPGDLEALRPDYTDLQILEILFTAGINNEMSRWTDALGIPQESDRDYLQPASEKYRNAVSQVAALDPNRPSGQSAPAVPPKRPRLESRQELDAKLAECQTRQPRLPLLDDAETRRVVGPIAPAGPLPHWMRLLANFPVQGLSRIRVGIASESAGVLEPLLRGQIAWIAAREDHAWYAIGHARKRLHLLGQSDDEILALDGSWENFSSAQQAAFALVRKLTSTPQWITDADIDRLRPHFNDKQIAEIVHRTTLAAFFDRVTEAAGLPLEAE